MVIAQMGSSGPPGTLPWLRPCIPAWNPQHVLWRFSFLVGNDRWHGSLKIWWSSGWSCIRFLSFIRASVIIDSEGWYCVTKGNIFVPPCNCFVSGVQTTYLCILFLIVGFLPGFWLGNNKMWTAENTCQHINYINLIPVVLESRRSSQRGCAPSPSSP